MRDSFDTYESWQALNASAHKALGLPQASQVKAYRGLPHALIEVTQSLAKLFPHKKKLVNFTHKDPYFKAPLTGLIREGYDYAPMELNQVGVDEMQALAVDRDLLFVLAAGDWPLLGISNDLGVLNQNLADTRVPYLRVFHNSYPLIKNKLELHKNTIDIFPVHADLAFAVTGQRIKLASLVSENMSWSEQSLQTLQAYLEEPQTAKEDVVAFEEHAPAGSEALFKDYDRWHDRAILTWTDMDGHALIDELAESLNLELPPPGSPSLLETTSLSRWGGLQTMDWLQAYGISPEQVRGTVIIDQTLLKLKSFEASLVTAHTKVLAAQGCGASDN